MNWRTRCSLGIFAALACLSAIVTWGAPILPPAVGSAFCSSNNPPETSSDPSSCVLGGASASVETGPFGVEFRRHGKSHSGLGRDGVSTADDPGCEYISVWRNRRRFCRPAYLCGPRFWRGQPV